MASTFLSFTQGTATSRRIFTISVWVKRANLSAQQQIFETWLDNNNRFDVQFTASDKILVQHTLGGSTSINIETSRLFRDTSAWYHIVVEVDTTQATASDRVKIYINGSQETSLSPATYPSQNLDLALGTASYTNFLGKYSSAGGNYFDGQMTNYHFTDGTAYSPSDFGETDATTGIWKPITEPSVTYGNNGFFLKFENSGAFGTDSSGNSNTFTVNGTMTQTIDTPSNVFATMNPLDNFYFGATFSNGNLKVVTSASIETFGTGTIGASSGKYYWEVKVTSASAYTNIGIASELSDSASNYLGEKASTPNYMYDSGTGNSYTNGSGTSYGDTYTTNDIIGVALDLDNNRLFFSKNGTWQNSGDPTTSTGAITITDSTSTPTGFYFPAVGDRHNDSATLELNFGNGYFGTTAVSSAQNPDDGIGIFEYAVPTGYKALCTKSINAQEYD